MPKTKHFEVSPGLHTRAKRYSDKTGLKLGIIGERAISYALLHPEEVFFGYETTKGSISGTAAPAPLPQSEAGK